MSRSQVRSINNVESIPTPTDEPKEEVSEEVINEVKAEAPTKVTD